MRPLLAAPLLFALGCTTPSSRPAPAATPPTKAIVQPVDTHGVALFYGEREMLRRAIADHLRRKSSLHLAPLSDLALEVLRAQLTKDRAECGAPTVRAALLASQHPDAVYVRSNAACTDQGCRLEVRVSRPPAGGTGAWEVLERWAAPVTDPTNANQWVDAVGSLAPAPPPKGGGALLGATRDDVPRVEVLGIDSVHAFSKPPTPADFSAVQPALDGCHASGWSSAGTDRLAIELAPNGKVARCEGDSSRADEAPARMKCLCRAASGVRFEPGPRGRRLEVRLMNHPGFGPEAPDGVYVHLEEVTLTPKFAIGPALADAKGTVAACATRESEGQMQVSLPLDGVGRAGTAAVSASTLPPRVQACMTAALEALRLPCPPARRTGRLDLRVRVVVR